MKEKLQRNVIVIDLIIGTTLFGILAILIGMFIAERKFYYGLGVALGTLISIAMAVHMNYTIGQYIGCGEKIAIAEARKSSLLRYGCVVILLGILMVTNVADPIAAFIGVMGLKIAAYLQPFTHKVTKRFIPDLPPAPPLEETQEDSERTKEFEKSEELEESKN